VDAAGAQHADAFIDALGVNKLDALGFSMGGFIAQQLTIDRPDLVRKPFSLALAQGVARGWRR
jgi:pimeloyl-ACP methyl ester carboxylesterase